MTLSPHPEDRASLTASPPAPSLRPALSPLALKLLVTAFLLATANATFWDRFTSLMGDRPLMIAGGGVIAYAAILFCISVFTLPGLVRPVLAMSLVLGAVASLAVGLLLEYARPIVRVHGERAAKRLRKAHPTIAPPPPPPPEV